MTHTPIEILGAVFFGLAVLHTFSIKLFQRLALRFKEGSIRESLFHWLGEVEIVFGLWAGLYFLTILAGLGPEIAIRQIQETDFTEPLFVFVIMCVAATRPIVDFANWIISTISRALPLSSNSSFYFTALVFGPLLGSLITEPAAMTVTAWILKDRFFKHRPSPAAMYLTLGILFVNISVGGALTPFAAPPIVMIAHSWGWGLKTTFSLMGWKAILITLLNSLLGLLLCRKSLKKIPSRPKEKQLAGSPFWLQGIHLLTLAGIVCTSHYSNVFMGIFLFFLGIVAITEKHQNELQMRQSLLVSFFLGGLVFFGQFQSWWLHPLIQGLKPSQLMLGATGLTAFADNAAITYLGAQIPNATDAFKYALVTGAITGGGLTVIANAPNPAGFTILRDTFGPQGISPLRLGAGALIPTLIALSIFRLFQI